VVLTANASAACRLVAEAFPFGPDSTLLLAADNHNSVNGTREHARRAGARLASIPLDDSLRLVEPERALRARRARGPSLFAFPAQSNFSGARHALSLVTEAQRHGWRVLLDAASYLPTADLDLRAVCPDFVVLSLYKIIGHPTGVGALVARNDALRMLVRPWFAGGTVRWVSVAHGTHRLSDGAEAYEDGTPAFGLAGGVAPALHAAVAADRDRLARHVASLTGALLDGFAGIDARGAARVRVHGPRGAHGRGGTVAFTVHAPDGRAIPYWTLETDARVAGIALRGGCFCNPGCAEAAFGLGTPRAAECLRALGDDFTIPRFAAALGGAPVGALRVSFGLGSVHADVARVLAWLAGVAERHARPR
jgi:selenocysteine lyase/cysteine desulfurase